jgi:hypothetical protein
MAIKFLHDLDLTGQELQNVKLHVTSSAPTAAAGAIYFDSGANVVKVHDGTSFKTLSTDTDDALNQYSTSVVDSSGIKLRLSGSGTSGNTTDDVEFAGSGTVSVARTNASKITITGASPSAASATATGVLKLFSNTEQSVAANEVTSTNGRTYGLQVDSNGRGVVNIPWTDTDTNTQRSAGTGLSLSSNTLNVNVGATGTTQAPQSISTTANRLYQVETDDQDNLVVNVPWSDTNTNTDTSGHVALLAAAPGGTITATPTELNVLDGFAGVTADLTYAKDLRATGVTTTEFDKLDGLTATTSELNILDGVTATTSEINILDGVTASTTEINLLDGITTLSGSNTGDEPDADTGTKGIVELATSAETQTGTDTGRAVTPDGLASRSVHATIDVSNSTFASGNQVAAIQHNLGTEDVIVQLFDSSTKETVYAVVERKTFAGTASTSTIRITFSSVPDNDVEVMITSIKGSTAKTPSYS